MGPKSYRPLTPVQRYVSVRRRLKVYAFAETLKPSSTSIDCKSLVIKEPSLQSILHLGPVNNVIFGLQRQLLQS